MATRSYRLTTKQCPSTVGQGGNDICIYNRELPYKILFKKQNGADPFAGVDPQANVIDETVWDTMLALTDANDPDNVCLTPKLFNGSIAAGDPNVVTSDSGQKQITHFEDGIWSLGWASLSETAMNNLAVTMNDNHDNLEFIYIPVKGNSIITALDAAGNPTFIKANLTFFKGRQRDGGRGSLEMNMGEIHIYEGEDYNWKVWPVTGWTPKTKLQAFAA